MNIPPLADWLRWLGEMPAVFRGEPEGFEQGRVRVRAVVADVVETLTGAPASAELLAAFDPLEVNKVTRNRLRWVLAATHLLWHPSFRETTGALDRKGLERLLVQELTVLAQIVAVDDLGQEERREELVRRALRLLGLRLPGETPEQAEDRLKQVDSIERHRVLVEAAVREKRAREVREAMARKAAQEAAAKVSRE